MISIFILTVVRGHHIFFKHPRFHGRRRFPFGPLQGRIQDFKLGGGGGRAHIKKLRRAERGAKFVWVFRVKNHYFTQKNLLFSNFRGAPGALPPRSAPAL
jgi:hypothetical protein